MITPDPVNMENENGRLFQLELGKFERVKIDKSQDASQAMQVIQQNDKSGATISNQPGEDDDQYEKQWT